jgi:hypothetical protein
VINKQTLVLNYKSTKRLCNIERLMSQGVPFLFIELLNTHAAYAYHCIKSETIQAWLGIF